MVRHKIICATNDAAGVIQTIGNTTRSWSRPEAVRLIKASAASFYVQQPGTLPTDIHVYAGQYLRTDQDGDRRNNLDELQACAWA